MIPLPIDQHIDRIQKALFSASSLILQASPGSGKTTRIPPAMLRFMPQGQQVLVFEPRRIAAKWAATRVAEEMGERVGQRVGYHFRFEKSGTESTSLWFLTQGMFLRRLASRPDLQGVGLVILDEFHERHLHADVALAWCRHLQKHGRPDLKILVLSATLEVEALSKQLGGAAVIDVDAPRFPVETFYSPLPERKSLAEGIAGVVKAELSQGAGDTLVFLPGMADILRVESALQSISQTHRVLKLHGELSIQEQEQVLRPQAYSKIILSTNIAESSLTIEGIKLVIDSGLHRQGSYSHWSGVPALRTRPICRASAIQRAGRAGRLGPGRCVRLYSEHDFQTRPYHDDPEIVRADLSQLVLEMIALGIVEVETLPWLEAPSTARWESALALLSLLGAIEKKEGGWEVTAIGKRMLGWPLVPRLARLVEEGASLGVLAEATVLAVLLSEGSLETLDVFDAIERARPQGVLWNHLRGLWPQGTSLASSLSEDRRQKLTKAILVSFADRLGRRKDKHAAQGDLVMSQGGSATVRWGNHVYPTDFFVGLEIQESQNLQAKSRSWVSCVCPVEEEMLWETEPSLVTHASSCEWDSKTETVVSKAQYRVGQLVLSEEGEKVTPGDAAGQILISRGLGLTTMPKVLGGWRDPLSRVLRSEIVDEVLGRFQIWAKGELGREASFTDALASLMKEQTGFKGIRELGWPEGIEAYLIQDPKLQNQFQRELPLMVVLARGRKVRVHYSLDREPWIESRLQDFFGMKEGPKIMGGRQALTLHLLAPNQRAVQVTTDLASFWKNTYPELRTQLSRRYPRHSWPESPT